MKSPTEEGLKWLSFGLRKYVFRIPVPYSNDTMLIPVMCENVRSAVDIEYDRYQPLNGAN